MKCLAKVCPLKEGEAPYFLIQTVSTDIDPLAEIYWTRKSRGLF